MQDRKNEGYYNPMKKRIFIILGVLFLAILTWGGIYLNSLLPIITGYPAKYLCSAVFISNRDPGEVEATDLRFSFIQYAKNEVNYQEKSVTSRFLWGKSKAIFREGFGSTLLRNADEAALRQIQFPALTAVNVDPDTIEWPAGNVILDKNTGIDKKALAEIMDRLVVRNEYNGHAFGSIVIHKGIPVAEKYKGQFNKKTRFLSWSMAKSFTNALAGIMVMEGKLDINQPAGISMWQNDERRTITMNNLMKMQSGLHWNEDYGNRSDVTLMLYEHNDFAGYASRQPLDYPVGGHWYYSSGSANIVCELMRKKFDRDDLYWSYAHSRLFDRTGMQDVVFEVDPTGTQAGSSYIYATVRDFARFGTLYLNDGVFNGERVLPEGWVKYSTVPVADSKGSYGSFFWLNRGKYYPSAPEDMYFCFGYNGQRIFIIPSKDLIIVVVGYSPKSSGGMNFDLLLKDILGTIKS